MRRLLGTFRCDESGGLVIKFGLIGALASAGVMRGVAVTGGFAALFENVTMRINSVL